MKKIIVIAFLMLTAVFLFSEIALAGGAPWRDHAFPYDFFFGNHIDTHQQTQLKNDGDLFGFFYITFTGEITSDGLPVAKHCEENTPPSECVVGWILRGKPGEATFLFHHMIILSGWLTGRISRSLGLTAISTGLANHKLEKV